MSTLWGYSGRVKSLPWNTTGHIIISNLLLKTQLHPLHVQLLAFCTKLIIWIFPSHATFGNWNRLVCLGGWSILDWALHMVTAPFWVLLHYLVILIIMPIVSIAFSGLHLMLAQTFIYMNILHDKIAAWVWNLLGRRDLTTSVLYYFYVNLHFR